MNNTLPGGGFVGAPHRLMATTVAGLCTRTRWPAAATPADSLPGLSAPRMRRA
jgi:hypothetical protein